MLLSRLSSLSLSNAVYRFYKFNFSFELGLVQSILSLEVFVKSISSTELHEVCRLVVLHIWNFSVNNQDLFPRGITPCDHMDIPGSRFPMVKVNLMITYACLVLISTYNLMNFLFSWIFILNSFFNNLCLWFCFAFYLL